MEFKHELVKPNDDLPYRMFIFEGKQGNYKVPKHWHQSLEIFLVLDGEIDFYINSTLFSLQKGQFILVNSNEIHSIECPKPNFTIVLQIPRKVFQGDTPQDHIMFKSTRYEKDAGLIELIERMYTTYEKKEYGYTFRVLSDFYELLYILSSKYKIKEVDEATIKQKNNLEKLSNITNYIQENYQEDLTLESVAEHFGFTPTYLSKIFQKYAKINYKTFLLNIRVSAAYKQMMNTDLPLSEIATRNGFPDSRSFSKAFFKRYEVLPSVYRKNK